MAKKPVTHLVIPNRRPYNDLWLAGRIPFKTRGKPDRTFEAHYGKTVYLYNSGRIDWAVMHAHDWTKEDMTPAGCIVAKGVLQPFRPLTQREKARFERAVWNGRENDGIYGVSFMLQLADLEAVKPFEFAWPSGPVRHTLWTR